MKATKSKVSKKNTPTKRSQTPIDLKKKKRRKE
jgi:hypothetical protein